MTGQHGNHAAVIGASMAGLLAARVLADHFKRVTIIERDRLSEPHAPRKGVPQGRHAHALLARGQTILERLFPGLIADLVADGAVPGDMSLDGRWHQGGGYKVRFDSGRRGVLMSRPLLEGHVRRRVLALPAVATRDATTVLGLLASADRARVTGVRLAPGGDTSAAEPMTADLVIDAGGRGAHAGAWLEQLGYQRAPEEAVKIGVGYTTRLYRRRPGELPDATYAVIAPMPPRETRLGVLFPIEGERWMVTLGGWLGDHAPADEAGFLGFAASLPAPDIYQVIRQAQPLSDFAVHAFPANLRRRYERLSRVPEGYLVLGDAICSFNPIYGQGMSSAALQAETLGACLATSSTLADLPRHFYRRVARVVDIPWQVAAGADFAYPTVEGVKPPGTDAINWYMRHVQRANLHDPVVYGAFLAVVNLLKPPSSLLAPSIVWRVARAALARHHASARLTPAPGGD